MSPRLKVDRFTFGLTRTNGTSAPPSLAGLYGRACSLKYGARPRVPEAQNGISALSTSVVTSRRAPRGGPTLPHDNHTVYSFAHISDVFGVMSGRTLNLISEIWHTQVRMCAKVGAHWLLAKDSGGPLGTVLHCSSALPTLVIS